MTPLGSAYYDPSNTQHGIPFHTACTQINNKF